MEHGELPMTLGKRKRVQLEYQAHPSVANVSEKKETVEHYM